MFRRSFRVLLALAALLVNVSVARADSVGVTGTCVGCWGTVWGDHVDAFPMFYSTTSDFSTLPGLGAEFQTNLPWLLVLNAGRFTTVSADGDLTISGRITALQITFTPVLHQPLV